MEQRRRMLQILRERYGAEEERLWAKYPQYAVFRHPASRKWFAVLMEVPRNRLGLEGAEAAEVLNVKCDSRMTGPLLSGEGFLPAYHMNKSTWVSILLDGSVPDSQILPLLDWSYDSTAPNIKRRRPQGPDA